MIGVTEFGTVQLLLFLFCLQVRTFPVSLWSASEVSYLSVTADIHMSQGRDSCCQLGVSEYKIKKEFPAGCGVGYPAAKAIRIPFVVGYGGFRCQFGTAGRVSHKNGGAIAPLGIC